MHEIAWELQIDTVIEGTVLRSGDRVRISVQLIEARTDSHLWAESYERDLGDVLALQAELARSIVREVRVKLTPQEQAQFAQSRPVNPEAYEAYLKGRYHWNRSRRPKLPWAQRKTRSAVREVRLWIWHISVNPTRLSEIVRRRQKY
jgi:hypothetical protein